jgi:hypothetical protein
MSVTLPTRLDVLSNSAVAVAVNLMPGQFAAAMRFPLSNLLDSVLKP